MFSHRKKIPLNFNKNLMPMNYLFHTKPIHAYGIYFKNGVKFINFLLDSYDLDVQEKMKELHNKVASLPIILLS